MDSGLFSLISLPVPVACEAAHAMDKKNGDHGSERNDGFHYSFSGKAAMGNERIAGNFRGLG